MLTNRFYSVTSGFFEEFIQKRVLQVVSLRHPFSDLYPPFPEFLERGEKGGMGE